MNKEIRTLLKQLSILSIGLCMTLSALSIQAQTTATRIESARNTSALNSIQFEEPEEFVKIRRLLSDKKIDQAKELALAYVDRVEKDAMDVANRYFARNALCVVYTHAREDALAEKECTTAVELMPSHWSAWNNRGTARYLAGNMTGAKQDYESALERSGSKEDIKELLEHNIALVDEQS